MMASLAATNPMDAFGRSIRDLRISVTDRCNFRCVYCMPREIFGPGYAFVPRDELLRLEEIVRIAKVFAACGVKKVRITGGEPMIRRNLEHLIEMIASIEGIDDISMTTNASYLSKGRAVALKDAGLNRITVSLDALDEETFRTVCDIDFPVSRVLEGIENARQAGFENIKINAVIKRGLNEHSVLPLARYFQGTGSILRFIEYMDVGSPNNWKLDEVVSASELVALINQEMPIDPVSPNYRGEVAKRWRYADGGGEIGFITSVTESFCGDCSRVRLSAVGQIYTCLFATEGYDIRDPLRAGASDQDLLEIVHTLWGKREDRYSELRGQIPVDVFSDAKVEMSHIGG